MRIHRLQLRAFGPFPGEVELDFEELNRAGLFLLTGETGAGKSTLLEAICFALYGQTTVSENSKALKSAWAQDDVAPGVEMEFSVGSWRYLVVRTPEWLRPSKRKTKNAWQKEQATVSLNRVAEDRVLEQPVPWENVSVRLPETAEHLQSVLGLNRSQFEQVVMLPQGRFAQFLDADSTQREGLLKKLFSTETFDQTMELLKERAAQAGIEAQESAAEILRVREQVEQELARLAEAFPGSDAEDARRPESRAEQDEQTTTAASASATAAGQDTSETAETDAEDHLSGLVQDALARAAQVQDAAEADRERVRGVLEESRREQHRAEQAVRAWAEHRDLLRRREELEARAEQRDARRQALEQARAAAPVVAALRREGEAEQQQDEGFLALRGELESLQAQLPEDWGHWPWTAEDSPTGNPVGTDDAAPVRSDSSPEETGSEPAERERTPESGLDAASTAVVDGSAGDAEHEAWQTRLAAVTERLDRGLEHRRRQRELAQAADRSAADRDEAQRRAQDLQARHEDQTAVRDQTDRDLAALEAALADQADPGAAVERAQEALDLGHRLQSAQSALPQATRRAAEQEEARLEASRAVDELLSRRFEQAAGLLAADLREGSPCPVCGSTDHPHPLRITAGAADGEGEAVTEDAVRAARERREQAEARAEHSRQELVQRQAEVQGLRDRGASEDLEEAEQALRQAREAETEHHRQRRELEVLRTRWQQQSEELERTAERREQARLDLARAQTTAEQQSRDLHRVEQELDGIPTEERIRQLQTQAAGLLATSQGLRRLQSRQHALARGAEDARSEARQALAASGLASADRARDAALPAEDLQRLEQEVQREHDEVVSWQAAWDRPAHLDHLAAVEQGAEEPDEDALRELEERTRQAGEASDAAVAAVGTVAGIVSRLREVSDRVEHLEQAAEQRVARAQRLKDLSDVAHGSGSENTLRMSLTTYVLAAELEEIAQAASVRLAEMTGCRYSIHHTDERAARGRKSGLGLEVFDAWTSRSRGTSTLSGGETFMTSLCLALGLADIVQARAGGIELDTLFVDEGFGSLDEETLDQVMDAVDGLRENGRVIGLVSHVADMKSRIPHHVRVRRSPTGSTVESSSA